MVRQIDRSPGRRRGSGGKLGRGSGRPKENPANLNGRGVGEEGGESLGQYRRNRKHDVPVVFGAERGEMGKGNHGTFLL